MLSDYRELPELDVECPECGDRECGWYHTWSAGMPEPPFECVYSRNICGVCGRDEICSVDGYCVPGGCLGECDEEVFVPAGLFCWMIWDEFWGEEVPAWLEVCMGTGWSSEVWIDDFYIDKYEVTNRRYRRCFEAGECPEGESHVTVESDGYNNFFIEDYFTNPSYDNYPVLVSGHSSLETFCRWEGKRLPTQEEWMKAALGGCRSLDHCNPTVDLKKFPWGNEDPEDCSMANLDIACVGFYQTVGAYPTGQSPYGMMDACGNAREWLQSFIGEEGIEEGIMLYPYVSYCWFTALNNEVYYHSNPDSSPEYPLGGTGTVGGRCARDP